MINIITLIPSSREAIVRHGAFVAELVANYAGQRMFWDALDHAATAVPHMDASSEEKLFAADLIDEAAMMLMVAAELLRKEAGK